jgi:amino acid adenylation domain-containing protein
MTAIPYRTPTPIPGTASCSIPVEPACGEGVLREAYEWVIGWLGNEEPGPDPAMALGPGAVLTYDTELFDSADAARVAGYVAATAGELAKGPLPQRFSPLSDAERQHLIHERAGRSQAMFGRPFHEHFAERAGMHPETIAATSHDGQAWSYGELDRAANRIANGLLARGLAPEEVVAVATGRSLGWLAAIIGIFKAGGAYLPIEPDYPPARVSNLLAQSRSRLLITPESLDELMTGPDHAPQVDVGPDRLAYVYFTSGSTGLPKGAMCEHAGMINHLQAKVGDFGLGKGCVVIQNAQATFDISLWQLIAPLLVGGRTHIVAQEEILDVRRFLDTIVKHGATVLQVVPSYLDILLRETERQPRDLGALTHVCVTGEAISKPLVERFFAQHPGLRLVNAYGATEASDDTTHEIMTAPPNRELVPVGRPIDNVTVYILGPDDTLRPLEGAGEIAFSGVCVGRGYINDPQRTAEAFGPDPFRPGNRLYRTGDFGRWLPNGSLEFHGRRDEQVKINGIRIELGEVEARLREHPEVGAASVIVAALPGVGKSLVGFYAGKVEPDAMREHLRHLLPANAIPARLHTIDELPLNQNGKVDKKILAARALALDEPAGGEAPATPTERRIAQAWAEALDRPLALIGRDDHFFEVGGGSLTALRAVAALDGLIGLDDLLRTPVLRDLAAHADEAGSRA